MKTKILKLLPALTLALIAIIAMLTSQIFISSFANAEEVVEYETNQVQEAVTESTDLTNSKILVLGKAEQSFEADQAIVNVQIESLDLDEKVSKEKNKELLQQFLQALQDEGIEKDKVSISYFSSYATTAGFNNKSGTRTCTSLCYEVDNIDKLMPSIEKAIEIGAQVDSINYKLSDYQSKYDDLLTLAIENAKAKAKKLLGKEDAVVLKIKEECSYHCDTKYQSYCEGMDSSLLNGKITVTAEVQVLVS